jgi:hypothetical protein
MQTGAKVAICAGLITTLAVVVINATKVSASDDMATLSGFVIDQDGYPISGVFVEVLDLITETDHNGYYKLNGLEPGTYDVYFIKAGYNNVVK